jgi:hypothetical protein
MDFISFLKASPVFSPVVAGLIVAAIVALGRRLTGGNKNANAGTLNTSIKIGKVKNLINVVDVSAVPEILRERENAADQAVNTQATSSQESNERRLDFDGCIIASTGCMSAEGPMPLGLPFECDTYLVPVGIAYYLEDEDGEIELDVLGDSERVTKIGVLKGTLILGRQLFSDGEDYFLVCDDCSGDLGAMASDCLREGMALSADGGYRNTLCIDSVELSSEVIESSTLTKTFFDTIPQAVFERYHVMPELICYIVATADGYYEKAKRAAELDQRSVDGRSPIIYVENGFKATSSKSVLYKITEGTKLPLVL